MRTTFPPGPAPFPRRRLNPAFYATVRRCGTPVFKLTSAVGLPHASVFSALICSKQIIATPINVSRLEAIADAVGFDKTQLFVDGAR